MDLLAEYGWTPEPSLRQRAAALGLVPARIVETRRDRCKAVCPWGQVPARPTGAFRYGAEGARAFPAVGDFALLKYNPEGESGIAELLPRKTLFSRVDCSGHAETYAKNPVEQVLAANFDLVFILCALDRRTNPGLIARCLAAARQSGAQAAVLLTKADLLSPQALRARTDETRAAAPDAPIVALSSATGLGLDALDALLPAGQTALLLGPSGAGKSSLTNALARAPLMTVQAVRTADGKGRHTTSHRQLVKTAAGALLIDTPGLRELGLWRADQGLKDLYSAVETYALQCRFANCRHQSEPDCAVKAAVQAGLLSADHVAQYLSFKAQAAPPRGPKKR
jgi:ribosome biogenesis GTPase